MSATLPMRQNGRREEKHLQLPRQCTGLPAAVTAAVFSKTLQKNQIFHELCASSALLQAHKNEKALFGKEWGFH
ncbi:hypothetical protein [Chromobacterium vaccinii]|uniref:hypothetical protein n=1 Tax=Chromobacterium vaccinii TaxID=1108595 RepID=UPI0011C05AE8|nr:hypothetical protein [Chromobacterium vaccinii]